MKSLSDKITQQQCLRHGEPLVYLCLERNCKHQQRILCDQCLDNTNGLINIQSAFEFLGLQQTEQEVQVYKCQAHLWQEFIRSKYQIIELLNKLESQMETAINSLIGNYTMETIYMEYLDMKINNNDIQSLGLLLSRHIVMDLQGNCQLSNAMQFKQQVGYSQFNKVLNQVAQGINNLGCKLKSIENEIMSNKYSKLDQEAISQAESTTHSYNYQISQSIVLNETCMYMCFNKNYTQIVAAVGKQIILFNLSNQGIWVRDEQLLIGHKEDIRQVKFNHNSTQFVSCSEDKLIIIWNKHQNGEWSIQDRISTHTEEVLTTCYNHDSTIIASASGDTSIQIHVWNNDHWILQQQIIGHSNCVNDICFNQDSQLFASASDDSLIILWKCDCAGQWMVQQQLTGHTKCVLRVAFNSLSTQLISGSNDMTIKVWSVDQQNIWKCNHTLVGHTDIIRSVNFNGVSDMIVSSSWEKSIKVWRINRVGNWECTQTITEHTSYITFTTINRDSSMIISGSEDNTIKIYLQYSQP